MSTTDDENLLNEYEVWRESVASQHTIDLTPAAFLKEQRDEANQWRISEAKANLHKWIGELEQHEEDYIDVNSAIGNCWRILNGLEDDRPYVIDSTLTGQTERIYT
ncbi:hypothetical protein [Frigoribacterium sp. UYMn621]|uniref:hypothetical protein n=1 Tax=Frigoribacterium sp. UYMn621 TaxID=3156343 RepID=UPI003398BFA7